MGQQQRGPQVNQPVLAEQTVQAERKTTHAVHNGAAVIPQSPRFVKESCQSAHGSSGPKKIAGPVSTGNAVAASSIQAGPSEH
jgi:hypothetical protein